MDKLFKIAIDIPDVSIVDVEKSSNNTLIIRVKSTKKLCKCRMCGKDVKIIHGYANEISLRHLSILGMKVFLKIRPARFMCDNCDDKITTTEQPDWYNRKSKFTKAYEKHLMCMLINSTVSDVAQKEGASFDDIEGVMDRQVDSSVNWDRIKSLDIIGLDEISLKKGHKSFVVIVSAKVNGIVKIIGMLADRKKETLKDFFKEIPVRLKRTITTVCSDMYDGYINAAKEIFGDKVNIVIDRFHVAMNYRKAADSIRKKELKRIKSEVSKQEYERFKGLMWVLRKGDSELDEEEMKMKELFFKYSPISKIAYEFQDRLTHIFDSDINSYKAKRRLIKWIESVKESELKCFDRFIATLLKYMDGILGYFHKKLRFNSGYIEGLNNKLKVVKRRCYGILRIDRFFQRAFLDLEGYKIFSLG